MDQGEFFHGGVEAGPAFVCGFGVFQGDGACCGTSGGEGGEGDAVIAEGVDGAGGDCAGGDFQCIFCGCCVYTQAFEHGHGGGDAVGFFCAEAADACEGGACLGGEDGEGHEEVGGVGKVDGHASFQAVNVVVDFSVALEAAGGEVFEADAASHFVGDDEVGGVAEIAFHVGGDFLYLAFTNDVGILCFFYFYAGFFYEGGCHGDVWPGGGVYYAQRRVAILHEGGEEGAGGELAGGFGVDFCAFENEAAFCFQRPGACGFHAVFF